MVAENEQQFHLLHVTGGMEVACTAFYRMLSTHQINDDTRNKVHGLYRCDLAAQELLMVMIDDLMGEVQPPYDGCCPILFLRWYVAQGHKGLIEQLTGLKYGGMRN